MTRPRTPAARHAALARVAEFAARSSLSGTAFLAAYRSVRAENQVGGTAHHPRAIAEAATVLAPHESIEKDTVQRLLGGARVDHARQTILDALGRTPGKRRAVGTSDDIEKLRDWTRESCGSLPETAFGSTLPYSAPSGRWCARVLALVDPAIRLNAALDLLLCCASRIVDIASHLGAWEALDRIHAARYPPAAHWPSPGATLELLENWIEREPDVGNITRWRLLATSSRRLRTYLANHPAVAARVAHALVTVNPPDNNNARVLLGEAKVARECRRHATADPLADNWAAFLELADRRVEQIRDIREAFDACCLEFGDDDSETRSFAITMLPYIDETPDLAPVTLDFRVWPAELLRRRLGSPAAPTRQRRADDCAHFLEFVGQREASAGEDIPPLLRAYRMGLFSPITARTGPQDLALREWLGQLGWQPRTTHLDLFRFSAPRDRRLVDAAFSEKIVLVPIHMAHYGTAVGRALLRTGMFTGNRISEGLQHAASERCFGPLSEEGRYFEATAKGGARERYYCDESTLEAMLAVIDVLHRNDQRLTPIPANYAVRAYCPPDKYIYRHRSHMIDSDLANCCLRIVLCGPKFSSHDLRHAFAKVAAQVGSPRAVQAAMHHRKPAQSSMYSYPTHKKQAELANNLAARLRGDGGPR